MTLFDPSIQLVDAPMQPGESLYAWLSRTPKPNAAIYRAWIDEQYAAFPDECKKDIHARFTNKRNEQHFGAAFELFMFGMFRAIGYNVTVPDPQPGSSRLDFVLAQNGSVVANVECTVVEIDPEANAEDRRIYELLEAAGPQVANRDFQVRVTDFKCSSQTVSAGAFAKYLDQWFDQYSNDSLTELELSGESRPTLEFADKEKGWRVSMELHNRIRDSDRIWCGRHYPTRQPPTCERIREAIAAKLNQHRDELRKNPTPHTIAITTQGHLDSIENYEMESILAGTQGWRFSRDGLSDEPIREANGVWTKPARDGKPRTNPAAVIFVENCFADQASRLGISLWENPHAGQKGLLPIWPFRKCGSPAPKYEYVEQEGVEPTEVLFLD